MAKTQVFDHDWRACRMAQSKDLIAVLADADNVSHSRMGAVLTEVARFGTASVRRVYGDFTKPSLSSWKPVASEHVIQLSSDSDFTRLASRIREEGVAVYGFGERKTPEAF